MSARIQSGDLVAVVRWTHQHVNRVGLVFEVDEITEAPARCGICGELIPGPLAVTVGTIAVPLRWLQKLNPPALTQGVKHREVLKA